MEQQTTTAINKLFWHVTTKDKKTLILKNGIIESDDGNLGSGVYCVETGDLTSLISVLSLDSFKDNGYELKDLAVVEFKYSGEYQTFKPVMRYYTNEKWIVIKNNISCKEIIRIM